MKKYLSLLCALGLSSMAAQASTLILADNFNGPDNTNFDNSDQTGRRSGMLGPDVQLRSALVQEQISNNQLLANASAGGSGRIRFHDAANLANWHDFATGSAGAAMLGGGGFRVEFDWLPTSNTGDNWVAFSVGIGGQSVAEPGLRVNHGETDFGILFRESGGTQYFDNGAGNAGTSFVATTASRHVVLDYGFNSFADGSNVTVAASVDGQNVANQTFQWSGNAGSLYMELESYQNGTLIDNFAISTGAVPEPSGLALTGLAGAAGLLGRRRRRN